MPAQRQQGKRPGTGRADLLYFLRQTDKDTLAASADFFGYQAPEEQKQRLEEQRAVGSNSVLLPPQKKQQLKAQESRTQQRFFRLKQRSQIQEQEPVTQPPQRLLNTPPFTGSIAQAVAKKEEVQVPVPQPLSPWRRIWPFLRAVLGAQDQSRQLDLDRIVRSLARGEVLRRFPCLSRAAWAMKAQVLVDLDPRIHFFWNDFYDLVERLQGMRGRTGLDSLCFEEGPLEPCTSFDPERRDQQILYRPPEPGTPILILSDLGLLNNCEQGWCNRSPPSFHTKKRLDKTRGSR